MAKQTITKRVCAHCKQEKTVMVTMDGGLMGEAFYFCIPCWRDGLHGKMSEVRYQRPPARAGRFLGKRRPR